jgi:N-dimethylarginine dimethylaminohydrolase
MITDRLGAEVVTIDPVDGLPDMVFTANAGLVQGRTFVPSRFRFAERRGEEPRFKSWFKDLGLRQVDVSGFHEGAGDLLFGDPAGHGQVLFAGTGFRTDADVHPKLSAILDVQVISLQLVNPRFYHLDTCFCPLPKGRLLWFPGAFNEESIELISSLYPASMRFAVSDLDASRFTCNAVAVDHGIVLNDCDPACQAWLEDQGFAVHRSGLSEFMKAGGAAKCLTLRVDASDTH